MSNSEDESLDELLSMRNELLNKLGVEGEDYFKVGDDEDADEDGYNDTDGNDISNEPGLFL